MFLNKKITVIASLAVAVIVSVAASQPPQEQPKRNLKVLPKDISHEDLDKVMDAWKDALGVKCNFCHAGKEVDGRFKMDFASDEKPEKQIARNMYKMTGKINKKIFRYKPSDDKTAVPPISCKTCHNGKPHPQK